MATVTEMVVESVVDAVTDVSHDGVKSMGRRAE
jgi:hypothetical protein